MSCNIETVDYIPKHKMNQFVELVCKCNGRFLRNPFECHSKYIVCIGFDESSDYKRFNESWSQFNTTITEVDKRNKFKNFWNRIKLMLKEVYCG